VNICVCEGVKVTKDGVKATLPGVAGIASTGANDMNAVAIFVVSATLVTVTVIVCGAVMVAGAIYRPPAERLPIDGLKLHVTAVFEVPVSDALNSCTCEAFMVTPPGVMEIPTPGINDTVAAAIFVVSAVLVAVTVTTCGDVTMAGAV
jgi:hypothetical protein